MSRYKNQNLFSSGPHRFHFHAAGQRTAEHSLPGADGVSITVLGKAARTIEQSGTLIADDPAALMRLIAAIEAAMDGSAGLLIDDRDRSWPGVVMTDFKPGPEYRVGPRLAVDYTARYLQLQP